MDGGVLNAEIVRCVVIDGLFPDVTDFAPTFMVCLITLSVRV